MIGGAGQSRPMLTMDDVQAWALAHRRVIRLLHAAAQDYVGARCCALNWLLPIGFVLGAQAAEAYLRALLLCVGEKRFGRHRFRQLLERASKVAPQLSKFDSLITMLSHAHSERYGDADPGRTAGYSSADIVLLDEFVVAVLEHIQIPEEVMCYQLPFHWLFEDRLAKAGWRVRDWLTDRNEALAPRLAAWGQRYNAIMDQHHPNRMR